MCWHYKNCHIISPTTPDRGCVLCTVYSLIFCSMKLEKAMHRHYLVTLSFCCLRNQLHVLFKCPHYWTNKGNIFSAFKCYIIYNNTNLLSEQMFLYILLHGVPTLSSVLLSSGPPSNTDSVLDLFFPFSLDSLLTICSSTLLHVCFIPYSSPSQPSSLPLISANNTSSLLCSHIPLVLFFCEHFPFSSSLQR